MTSTQTPVTGRSIIAGQPVNGGAGEHYPVNPATGERLEPVFSLVGSAEVDLAARAAAAAFQEYRSTTAAQRAQFLDAIADELDALRADIVARGALETGLPPARLDGELNRTTGQLRLFAREVRLGDFHGLRHDEALPERAPIPRPDLRLRKIPLGPVVVFGASNFPLAFSTAGGDTAAALAAGCPVVVKGHSAHAGTAELAGIAVSRAAARSGMPAGVFSVLFGQGAVVGQQLVAHPAIAAVGFTGSQHAGVELMATAAARPVPIPVYAEMSSINPVIIAPGAADTRSELADGFVASLTLGAGQFCTNPGLVLVPTGSGGDEFVKVAAERLASQYGQTMLTRGIGAAFDEGVARVRDAGAAPLAEGSPGDGLNAPAPVLFGADSGSFRAGTELHEEVFGSAALVVRYDDTDDLIQTLRSLGGQLTATLHMDESTGDTTLARSLVPELELLAGRIIVNGWPTGVEVADAMVHGGPFPATSDARATSVGTLSIDRFLRPVSYQGLPPGLLPDPFNDAAIPVRLNGVPR